MFVCVHAFVCVCLLSSVDESKSTYVRACVCVHECSCVLSRMRVCACLCVRSFVEVSMREYV